MSKRVQELDSQSKHARTGTNETPAKNGEKDEGASEDMGEFEDPYGDEFESEDEVFEAGEDGEPPQDDAPQKQQRKETWIPGQGAELGANEVLEADQSVYKMLHNVSVEWPCLSFDIVPDAWGSDRRSYPQKMLLVSGTQAERAKDNEVLALKLSGLSKTQVNDDDDDLEEDEEDEEYDADPILESRALPVKSTTNRVRVSPIGSASGETLAATSMENGEVLLWDLSPQINSFDRASDLSNSKRPIHTIKAHGSSEGYGLDWSPLEKSGALLSGDSEGRIYHTIRTPSGWSTDSNAFTLANTSVEDIQWSPVERTVFASAGTDGNLHIWDTRQAARKPAISVRASDVDVNVISWNSKAPHMIASGHDDGQWAVWDLRTFGGATSGTAVEPVASFKHHKQQITSIEFHPHDESVVAVASADSTVTLWDLAVEADDEEVAAQRAEGGIDGVPAQLLFIHWQPDVKEVHWHRQVPGALVSTGADGFSIWKTISV